MQGATKDESLSQDDASPGDFVFDVTAYLGGIPKGKLLREFDVAVFTATSTQIAAGRIPKRVMDRTRQWMRKAFPGVVREVKRGVLFVPSEALIEYLLEGGEG